MPWLDNVTVTKTGPAENGTMYVGLRPADNSFHRWFILEPSAEKEMLATALTAVAGAKKVQCYLSSTDQYGTVRRMYVKVWGNMLQARRCGPLVPFQAMNLSTVATSAWISATATLGFGLLLAFALKRAVQAAAKPLHLDDDVARVLSKVVISLVLVFAVVGALNQLGVEIGPLLGALGIGSVLIALSLQPVLGNLVGSVMLDARRPIRRGDQVHTNGQSGTVVDINGRAVVLKTFDGEVVYLPNLKVLEEPLINQTRDEYRRTVMPFQVAYDTDLRLAQKSLVTELRSLPALELAPPADVIVTGFGESGIDMAARFWHPSEELTARWVISEVAISVRETLAREGITIPFRQVVLHQAQTAVDTGDSVPLISTDPGDE